MRKWLTIGLLLLLSGTLSAQGEDHFPKPDRLVNDYAQILTPEQRELLEQELVAFDDTTSNQIAVIITPTLYGEDIMDLGTRIAHKWGIGREDLDNGVLVLIKSKTAEEPDGDVAILPGTGLEGALPDVTCKHIIDEYMVEHLAEGDYFRALVAGLYVIEQACVGEYSYERPKSRKGEDAVSIVGVILLIGLYLLIRRLVKGIGGGSSGGGHYTGGGSYRGSGGHSSGHSFGGFGGGSFGGGGAHSKF